LITVKFYKGDQIRILLGGIEVMKEEVLMMPKKA